MFNMTFFIFLRLVSITVSGGFDNINFFFLTRGANACETIGIALTPFSFCLLDMYFLLVGPMPAFNCRSTLVPRTLCCVLYPLASARVRKCPIPSTVCDDVSVDK